MSVFYEKRELFSRLREHVEATGVKCVLAVENAAFAEGKIENISVMEKSGVKFLTLVWNGGNELGAAHDDKNGNGLTEYGKKFCERLFSPRHGKILPDVSHLSDKGFSDLAEIARENGGEFVATHSGARALCGHSRNLTDEQIRVIADCGGVVGVPFYLPFLGGFSPAEHLKHIADVGGEDVGAIGSDFDGMEKSCYASPATAEETLLAQLKQCGISFRIAEKILQKNVLRVLAEK